MKTEALVLAGVAAGVVAVALLSKAGGAAGKVAETVGAAVNPRSAENLVYGGVVGGVGRTISQDESWSLGTWLWEVINPGAVERERQVLK